jgi:NADPH-dependent 2,4-dienoyl-CoA reductase/sulfur reductase-like enzyme
VLVGVLAAGAARVVMDRTQLPAPVEDDPGEVTGPPGPELLWTKLVAPALRAGRAFARNLRKPTYGYAAIPIFRTSVLLPRAVS